MFYNDLSNYQYNLAFEIEKVKNIGWLEKTNSFNKRTTDPELLKKLFQLIKFKECNIYRGVHHCDLCNSDGFMYGNMENEEILLGHGEIWIPSITQDIVYVSPTLIYHYIEKHQYCPPQDYIESVMAFDVNSDFDGEEMLKKFKDLQNSRRI